MSRSLLHGCWEPCRLIKLLPLLFPKVLLNPCPHCSNHPRLSRENRWTPLDCSLVLVQPTLPPPHPMERGCVKSEREKHAKVLQMNLTSSVSSALMRPCFLFSSVQCLCGLCQLCHTAAVFCCLPGPCTLQAESFTSGPSTKQKSPELSD